jgi:ABC-type branched-subunit amino acid transport system permease subunit
MSDRSQFQEPGTPLRPVPEMGPEQPKGKVAWVQLPSATHIVAATVVVGFLVVFPWLNPGYRFLSLGITTGITAIALYGLGIQFGQAGIMSVGHAAFIGIGAYTAAITAGTIGAGFWLALPFSTVFAAMVAGLVGLPSLRVSGQHYIIITFCFCALLNIALTNGGPFTGGATGLDVFSAAVLLVEQNAGLALAVASRGYLLQHGQIVACGPIAELRDNRLMHELYLGQGRAV